MKLLKTTGEETIQLLFRQLPITFTGLSLLVTMILKTFNMVKHLADNALLDFILWTVVVGHILLIVVFISHLYVNILKITAMYRRNRLTVKEILTKQYNYEE
ncbi:hypothetical protein SAMN02745133_01992 [Desulforamulus putei DSM 12395]|uniref:Uncharacterized protein n=1 Tax=Desulforamulus putei DSM 12395 TaxID=1121429 RepID=A0A1M4ZG47_9FIRM|nr:hypothetical protein [Desulforamulus putei]SHF16991.1 hypothetical protein SAMN02745133_01992 [Desulforamulus putei DSM 12395]